MRYSMLIAIVIPMALACGGKQKTGSPHPDDTVAYAGVSEAECRHAVEHYLEMGYAEATAEERDELETSGEQLYEEGVRECMRLNDRRMTECWLASRSTTEAESCGQ